MDKKKKIKIFSIIIAVIAVIAVAAVIISTHSLQIQYSVLYSMMPDSVERTVNDEIPIKIYKRENPDYDPKNFEDDPMSKLEFYYYDDSGEEVVIKGGDKLVYDGQDNGAAFISFLPGALEKLTVIKKVVKIVSAVIITLLIVGIIIFWFFRWSKKQDAEKEKKFGSKAKTEKSVKRKN